MHEPLISVCMLCYNHEQFVKEAIESILNQTYQNWELIIVDNASEDKSKEIIQDMIKGDNRIVFLPQEYNKLASLGFNIAMKHSCGEYISIISADDNFMPEKLQRQLKQIQEKGLDLSFTWVNVIDSESKKGDQSVQKWFNKHHVITAVDILREYFSMYNVTCAPTALIRSDILQNISLHDHRLLQTQDLEFWIRILKQTQKVEILHEELTNYRILDDGGNLSSNNSFGKINRTNFEMLYVWKQLFSIDNKILSKVFSIEITDKNKYQVIYNYLDRYDIFTRQFTVLLNVFESLGDNCDIESSQFKLFFEEYTKLGIVDSNNLLQKDENIVWLEEQLSNHQKALKDREKGIVWLEEQLLNYKKALEEKDKALKYKCTFKWFMKKMMGRK